MAFATSNPAWLKSAEGTCKLDRLRLLGIGLGRGGQLELVEHEVAVGRPARTLVGQAARLCNTSSRRPVIPVKSVSAVIVTDAVRVGPGDDDRAVRLLGQDVALLVALDRLGFEDLPAVDDRRGLLLLPVGDFLGENRAFRTS